MSQAFAIWLLCVDGIDHAISGWDSNNDIKRFARVAVDFTVDVHGRLINVIDFRVPAVPFCSNEPINEKSEHASRIFPLHPRPTERR